VSLLGLWYHKMAIPSKYLLARLSGIPWILNWLNRSRLLVLAYHGIYDGPKQPGSLPDTFVHVSDMEAQLKEIKRRYRVIDPEDLLQCLEAKSSLPPYAALITFDDGYESFFRLALPVLRSLGIKSVVFVATKYTEDQKPFYFDLAWFFMQRCSKATINWVKGMVGIEGDGLSASAQLRSILNRMKRMLPQPRDDLAKEMEKAVYSEIADAEGFLKLFRAMNQNQLKRVAAEGTTLGGHTHTHTIMTVMPPDMAELEVLENKRRLESALRGKCHFFAYPNGGEGDYNNGHKRLVRNAGYEAAFTLKQRRSSPLTDPMDISRINVVPEDTRESLGIHCSGIVRAAIKF